LQPSAETIAGLLSISADNRLGRYLLVPQNADVSHVPAGIHILTMEAFGFTNGKLTWLTKKKNTMRYPQKESTPA
jgi:hypothetical protein